MTNAGRRGLVALAVVTLFLAVGGALVASPLPHRVGSTVVAIGYVDDVGERIRTITTADGRRLEVDRNVLEGLGGPDDVLGAHLSHDPWSGDLRAGRREANLLRPGDEPWRSLLVVVAVVAVACIRGLRRARRPGIGAGRQGVTSTVRPMEEGSHVAHRDAG